MKNKKTVSVILIIIDIILLILFVTYIPNIFWHIFGCDFIEYEDWFGELDETIKYRFGAGSTEVLSAAGDIVIKSMMGGYLVYFNGKLIGDICDNELFLKRTPTSNRLLAESELRYPYEESKPLMHVFDCFDDNALISELLNGMYAELPEKKPKKAK